MTTDVAASPVLVGLALGLLLPYFCFLLSLHPDLTLLSLPGSPAQDGLFQSEVKYSEDSLGSTLRARAYFSLSVLQVAQLPMPFLVLLYLLQSLSRQMQFGLLSVGGLTAVLGPGL